MRKQIILVPYNIEQNSIKSFAVINNKKIMNEHVTIICTMSNR